ncbi:hypothetical protein ABZ805_24040 [Saccharopolyspora sp. NPDC047091]|uniref:hypothetical protein n=1 Tax=Saccharopolyspora sp. NPDC047091 TaxID=3155924 RepID=UPI00340E11D7
MRLRTGLPTAAVVGALKIEPPPKGGTDRETPPGPHEQRAGCAICSGPPSLPMGVGGGRTARAARWYPAGGAAGPGQR